jgi:hypothetical protein
MITRLISTVVILLALAPFARAQLGLGTDFVIGGAPGVVISTDGYVHLRQFDEHQELAAIRKRARDSAEAAKHEAISYVSLGALLEQAGSLERAGKPLPEELKYVHGLTQLRYVFVYPEEKDLVIGGPAEPWVINGPEVTGRRSGRPMLQLDDFVVALRNADADHGRAFGCGIYPNPESLKIAHEIATKMAASSRAQRKKAMEDALGPQDVRIFGTRADTRLALICVAADYKLKRLALGLDVLPTVPVGNGVDNSRSAANKFWFEASFEPLLVSKEGNAYQIRGQRLATKAGMFDFDPRGATDKAKAFATKLSGQMPALATALPVVADLQNIADWSLLASLIRRDHLDRKAGLDLSWLMDESAYQVAKVPVPKTAQTLVTFTNGSMAAGGVTISVEPFIGDEARVVDQTASLDEARTSARASGVRN